MPHENNRPAITLALTKYVRVIKDTAKMESTLLPVSELPDGEASNYEGKAKYIETGAFEVLWIYKNAQWNETSVKIPKI